ncbi:helix-turn-helix domain-containing protein [Burkholderia sp. LMU1-1-1.1]|uniref:helix-turn-helix domain-containing protein n=1 Tax=Burkholderia sp. LMU1-1-1.1 TaxID=3135266 RepID=UPI00341E7A1E
MKAAAAARLDLTRRQINRLIPRYIDAGASGLVSRKRGKPSSNARFRQIRKVLNFAGRPMLLTLRLSMTLPAA